MLTYTQTYSQQELRRMDAAEGRMYMAVGPYCWAKHTNAYKALRNARSYAPSYVQSAKDVQFTVFETSTAAWVDGMGRVHDPREGFREVGAVVVNRSRR